LDEEEKTYNLSKREGKRLLMHFEQLKQGVNNIHSLTIYSHYLSYINEEQTLFFLEFNVYLL